MNVRRKLVPWVAVLLAGAPAPAAVSWHLYPASCTGGSAAVSVPCGDYGRFLLDQTVEPPGCPLLDSGGETPPVYPQGPKAPLFPEEVYRLEDLTDRTRPATALRGSSPTLAAGGGSGSLAPLVQVGPAPAPDPEPIPWEIDRWLAVIDFDGPHGQSTT
jgi:hypothetical protein